MALSADGIGQLATLLDRGFYSTAFQPIVETQSGASVGFESLLRGPEGSLLEEPGRILNETDLVPDEWRLRIDHASIQALGVPLCQGFYLGRPQPAKHWTVFPAAGAACA